MWRETEILSSVFASCSCNSANLSSERSSGYASATTRREGAIAHRRQSVVGTLREEGAYTFHHMALAAGRWTFEGDADRPTQQARGHREVEQLGYLLLTGDTRAGQLCSEAPKGVRPLCQLLAPLPRLMGCRFRLRPLDLDPGLGVPQGSLEPFPEPLWVGEVQGAWVLVLSQL